MKGDKTATTVIDQTHDPLSRDIEKVRSLADLFDRSLTVPGTKFRIGVDGLIGLIPGVGDTLGLAPLAYYVYIAKRHRLPFGVYAKLAGNQLLDFLAGLIPIIGDLLDFVHKANVKNARLLEKELLKRQGSRPQPAP